MRFYIRVRSLNYEIVLLRGRAGSRRIDPPTVWTPQLYSPTGLDLKPVETGPESLPIILKLGYPGNENSPRRIPP